MPGHASYARRMTMLTGYVSSTPECDELLPCEGPGGGPPVGAGIDPNVTESSCPRFVPTDAGYSIVDYYTPTSASNWTHPNFLPGQPCL